MIKYCTNCLETNTRPNSKFTKEGLCFACYYYNQNVETYDEIERHKVLEEILKKYKSNKSKFDCIIGVSGGKDSTRQALWVRDKLNLKPLLVSLVYPPEQVTDVGTNNISNLIELGFDVLISAPAPKFWKKHLRKGFLNGNYLRGPELALYSSPVKVAIKYGIKLIFWGENPASIWNDSKLKRNLSYDGNSLRNTNTIKNCDLSWMENLSLDKTKLIPYKYPSLNDFKNNNIQIIFLDWFWENWSMVNNAKFSCLNGLEPKSDHVSNTGDLYGVSALDEDWVTLNQMIRYYKFGHARVSDYLNIEIRSGKISREKAIKIVEKYDGCCSNKYIKTFCKYTEISIDHFWDTVSKFVNKDLFTISNKKNGKKYLPKFKVGVGL